MSLFLIHIETWHEKRYREKEIFFFQSFSAEHDCRAGEKINDCFSLSLVIYWEAKNLSFNSRLFACYFSNSNASHVEACADNIYCTVSTDASLWLKSNFLSICPSKPTQWRLPSGLDRSFVNHACYASPSLPPTMTQILCPLSCCLRRSSCL